MMIIWKKKNVWDQSIEKHLYIMCYFQCHNRRYLICLPVSPSTSMWYTSKNIQQEIIFYWTLQQKKKVNLYNNSWSNQEYICNIKKERQINPQHLSSFKQLERLKVVLYPRKNIETKIYYQSKAISLI